MSEHLWTGNMLKGLKGPNHWLNLHDSIFVAFLSMWRKFISKNSVLVLFEILRLFVNLLTLDDKCYLLVKGSF